MLKIAIIMLMLSASFFAFGAGRDSEKANNVWIGPIGWAVLMLIICNLLVYA